MGKSDIVAQTRAVAANLAQVLASLGAGFGDVVKTNRWYAGGDGVEDFEAAALEFASNFQERSKSGLLRCLAKVVSIFQDVMSGLIPYGIGTSTYLISTA